MWSRAASGLVGIALLLLLSPPRGFPAPAAEPPSCTLSAAPASVTAGTGVTLSWSTTHHPTAAYITQGPDVRLLRPLPEGAALLPTGSKTVTVLEARTYTYTLTTAGPAGPSTCSTTVHVTGTATPADIPTVLDRIGLATVLPTSGHDPDIRRYDVFWTVNPLTATSPAMSGFYVPYNREPLGVPGEPSRFGVEEHHPIPWYRAHRPEWLVYRSDRTALALSYEYRTAAGQPYHLPPIDITNPAVREYIWSRRIAPALLEGHRLISFDNGGPFNTDRRGGVREGGDGWRQLFSGAALDPAYVRAVREWLEWMRRRINAAGARVAMNMDYGKGAEAEFVSIAGAADMVLHEGSFVDQGCRKDHPRYQDDAPGRPARDHWTERFSTFRRVAQRGGLVLTQACTAGQVPPGVLSWVIANYLLVRGPQTFIALTSGPPGGPMRSLVVERPEFAVRIGPPTGEPARIPGTKAWSRSYANGLVFVNPSATTAQPATLAPGTYRDLEGSVWQGRITVPPTTGLVLVATR